MKDKRLYIALFVLGAVVGGSWYVGSFQANLKKEVATFDENAWQEAVKESGIEIVDSDRQTEPVSENDSKSETVEVAETDTVPLSRNEEKPVVTEVKKEEPAKEDQTFSVKKPCKGEIVRECSLDELIYWESTQDWRTHNGVDFSAAAGDPVYATADGIVAQIFEDELLGTVLMLDHGNGYASIYGNIQNADFIKAGTAVKQGDVVGGVGKAGILESEDGTHLHFEILCGEEYVNPVMYFTAD